MRKTWIGCLLQAPGPGIEPSTWVWPLTSNQTHHPPVSGPPNRATPAREETFSPQGPGVALSIGRRAWLPTTCSHPCSSPSICWRMKVLSPPKSVCVARLAWGKPALCTVGPQRKGPLVLEIPNFAGSSISRVPPTVCCPVRVNVLSGEQM